MKHRYFKKSTILDCGNGTRPSYAWRSILFACDLLKKGMLKIIGDGKNTRVWSENWLMDKIPRPPTPPQGMIDMTLEVSDFWDHSLGRWDAAKVRRTFTAQDAEIILKMKLPDTLQDTYAWGLTWNGRYNTQSGYKLADTLFEAQEEPVHELSELEKRLWAKLWKLQTTPKIRNFLWRALAGALAVADRLQMRGMYTYPICKGCGQAQETICHILFNCIVASDIWTLAGILGPRHGWSGNSVMLNFHHLVSICNNKGLEETIRHPIPWILWYTWKARNILIFEQTRWDLTSLVQKAHDEAYLWLSVNRKKKDEITQDRVGSNEMHVWTKPQLSFFKCNIGVSWLHPKRNSGTGWLLRDDRGEVRLHSRRSFSKPSTRLEAELLSLYWAAESMVSMKIHRVIFELCSEEAYTVINHPDEWPFHRNIVTDILSCCRQISNWNLILILVSCNQAAEKIALSVTAEHIYQSYVAKGAPLWIQDVLTSEATEGIIAGGSSFSR